MDDLRHNYLLRVAPRRAEEDRRGADPLVKSLRVWHPGADDQSLAAMALDVRLCVDLRDLGRWPV